MHNPYHIQLGHLPDFRVRYRFYTNEEGGRLTLPFQGYRSDFWYDHPAHKEHQIFMIWPEFEDTRGEVILENDSLVSISGIARMWIIMPKMRPYHRGKIEQGLTGYFMEGSRKVAECQIIELIGLGDNPPQ